MVLVLDETGELIAQVAAIEDVDALCGNCECLASEHGLHSMTDARRQEHSEFGISTCEADNCYCQEFVELGAVYDYTVEVVPDAS